MRLLSSPTPLRQMSMPSFPRRCSNPGVMFHDDADIHTSPGGMMNDFPKAYSKLKTIADRKIHNYMDRKLPVYPVLMIGVGYRF